MKTEQLQILDTCDRSLRGTPLGKAMDTCWNDEPEGFANGSYNRIRRNDTRAKPIFDELDKIQVERPEVVLLYVNW